MPPLEYPKGKETDQLLRKIYVYSYVKRKDLIYIYIYQSLNPPQLIITKYSFIAQQIG